MKNFEFIVRPAYGEYAVMCVDGANQSAKEVYRGSEEACNTMLGRLYRANEVLQIAFSGELLCELEIVAL